MALNLLTIINYEFLLILAILIIHEKKLKLNVEIEITEDISPKKQNEKKSHRRRLIK
jgi:hypothetical protein